ncbi:unnamed protein product [Sphenostylis stenocarpa]|uniref:HECT-type E3 ubiquitin transferase n=1 Tax=Sphenostylis stenocarpa TaxID=92480 RepID=A0AA86THR7_9FABA|nr:unnamed protein product [Sphenostylis stenocarpa]
MDSGDEDWGLDEMEQEDMEEHDNNLYDKFEDIVHSLSEETEPSSQLALLIEFCEVLTFFTEDSFSNSTELVSPLLVEHAMNQSNPDAMLFSIRAMTYICDLYLPSADLFVEHDIVPTLCQRLFAIEYLDVAEQCIKLLEKISRKHPIVCLKAGVVMAVLKYIDFFSTSIQRVAISTVINICKRLYSESLSPFMDAVPILCNLLRYEDRQLVEDVATCLMKIVDRVYHSSEWLDKLCKHELIQQGLVGLLVKLSSGSLLAFSTLHELNISNILRDILSTFDLSHELSMSQHISGHCDLVKEVLKLLNELLPDRAKDQTDQLLLHKESFLVNHPDILQRFAMDLLPTLIKVFNCGASLYVCQGCLTVMYKIISFSKSRMLVELLKKANISRLNKPFLAGVFTQQDPHMLMLALQIVEIILKKFPNKFLKLFFKEGVFFAIDMLLKPGRSSKLMCPVYTGTQQTLDSQRSSSGETKCLCYEFLTGQTPTSSEARNCKIDNDSVYTLAKRIKRKYSAPEYSPSEKGLTDILPSLKALSKDLFSISTDAFTLCEEKTNSILYQIMDILNGKEQISTFEFIKSGVVKSLVDYLSPSQYMRDKRRIHGICNDNAILEKRFEILANVCFCATQSLSNETFLSILTRHLHNVLISLEAFPVILTGGAKLRSSFAIVPHTRPIPYPNLKIRFVREEGETFQNDIIEDFLTVDPLASIHSIEGYLWPMVNSTHAGSSSTIEMSGTLGHTVMMTDLPELQVYAEEHQMNAQRKIKLEKQDRVRSNEATQKLVFYFEGEPLDHKATLYQEIIRHKIKEIDSFSTLKMWNLVHKITYRRAIESEDIILPECHSSSQDLSDDKVLAYYQNTHFFSSTLSCQLVHDLEKSSPINYILFLFKCLENMNQIVLHLVSRERICAFAKGKVDDLDSLKATVSSIPQNEFVSTKLTEKLEQQLRDSLAVSIGGLPLWCSQIMTSCPFLFSFQTRCKYFKLKAFGQSQVQAHVSHNSSGAVVDRGLGPGGLPRKKFLVHRQRILESAAQMMELHASHKVVLEVEYDEEVGTGPGPTLEFYTLVCHEFQKSGLGMWREDTNMHAEELRISSFYGLFPRPWSSMQDTSGGIQFSEIINKFFLLGQVVAKAFTDGRILDFHFSKAFYKLILGKELSLFDIQLFDPELYKVLQEFQALAMRKNFMESTSGGNSDIVSFRDARIEDLFLDFTLPGYPDIILASGTDYSMVNMGNLEDYVSLVVEATVRSGISRQVEAFESGFNQVLPIDHIRIFNEEELERMFCGESDSWAINDLQDFLKFDHGYSATSPPIVNLLEILREFDQEQQRSFLQFVTGAPRLPPGGLASLNPKLTVVRKHCSNQEDTDLDLPSVMTCVNYLKLPPYSTKEKMKEKLLYAITEGQGAFHLS